jgi:hypothetical protein
VVWAIAEGRKAARAIDTYLMGESALPESREDSGSAGRSANTRAASPKYVLYNIFTIRHTVRVKWEVEFHRDFDPEFDTLPEKVQAELLAHALLLERFGPQLGRPRVDTLKGSRHANMKELRFDAADGVWRIAFAFDPQRNAVLLVAGDKSGGSERRFYRQLVAKADERFDEHLLRTKKKGR